MLSECSAPKPIRMILLPSSVLSTAQSLNKSFGKRFKEASFKKEIPWPEVLPTSNKPLKETKSLKFICKAWSLNDALSESILRETVYRQNLISFPTRNFLAEIYQLGDRQARPC